MDLKSALECMLSNDNTTRSSAERFYYTSLSQSPGSTLLSLISLLPSSPLQIQVLISVLLKQLIDPLSGKEIWSKMDSASQEDFKNKSLQVLRIDLAHKPCELFCEVVGKLGCSIFSMKNPWPELVQYLKSGLYSSHCIKVLEILSAVYVHVWKEIPLNPGLFMEYLQRNDLALKFSTIKALNTLLSVMKKKSSLPYAELIPCILTSSYALVVAEEFNGGRTLEFIREIAENRGFLFTDYLGVLYEFVAGIFKLGITTANKLLAAEIIVSLYETTTELDTSQCTQLMQDIFIIMVSGENEEDEDWEHPDENILEDLENAEVDYAKIGRKIIYRLIEAVGETVLLDPTLSLIQRGLADQDWRGQYSAILTLGELILFIAEPQKIADIIPIVINACSSSCHKVRYGGYVLITDLSQNYIQEFQATYHNRVFPVILAGFDDRIPRVRAQALAAATGFIEGAGYKISSLYINCIPKILSLLHNQISLVLQYAVTTISAFAKSAKTSFTDYYQNTIDELLNLLQRLHNPCYETLKGRVIESVTLCSSAVGKQLFTTKLQQIINIISSFEVSAEQEALAYILNSWENVCDLLQEDFCQYLDHIVPGLLKFISSPNEGVNVNTTEVINKEHALQTLSKFVQVLKGQYGKYLDETLRSTLPLVNYTLNDSLRATAAEILAGLVEAKKLLQDSSAFSHAQELAKVFLSLLVQAVKEEFNRDALLSQLEAIGKILQSIGVAFLQQTEVNEVGQLVLKVIMDKAKKGYDPDEDRIYVEATEVIGEIFKTHGYFTSALLGVISSEIIPKMLLESKEKAFHKYALYVIDDAIEFLSQTHPTNKWDEVLSILLCYANDADDEVRQAAVYGLGVYSMTSQSFGEKASVVLTALFCSLEIPSKRIVTYGHARDNSIAAISKAIKYQSGCFDIGPVIEKWVKFLPLKWDKQEAIQTHELFAEILEAKAALVIANNIENFVKTICIIADVVFTKLVNEKTTCKFQGFVKKHAEDVQRVWDKLSQAQQEKIQNLSLVN